MLWAAELGQTTDQSRAPATALPPARRLAATAQHAPPRAHHLPAAAARPLPGAAAAAAVALRVQRLREPQGEAKSADPTEGGGRPGESESGS